MENTVKEENVYQSKSYQWFLIFFCFFIYFTAQLGRYSYSSNINLFEQSYGVNHVQSGWVSTIYFLVYGAGQIINGIFSKRYNKRIACFLAVAVSSVLNFVVFFGVPFWNMYYLWAINAAAQSILYPTIMLTISENVEKKYLAAAAIVMACATTVGTFASYGMGALFSQPDNFRFSFVVAAAAMIVAGVVWLFGSAKFRKTSIPKVSDVKKVGVIGREKKKGVANGLGLFALVELAFFSFISYAVSGGVGTWMPVVMKEVYGLGNSLSAFLSAFLLFFSIFNSILSEVVYVKTKSFSLSSVMLFGPSVLVAVAAIVFLETNYVLLLVILIVFRLLTGAAVNLYTAKAPLYLADKCNAGFLSGFLNGLCYLGNAVSSLALGALAEYGSWSLAFTVIAIVTALPLLVYPVYLVQVKKDPSKKI